MLRLLQSIFLTTIVFSSIYGQGDEYFIAKRQSMVRAQIRNRGVADKNTLKAMETVPRHLFVPNSFISSAYDDRPLPIGYGQTISQPYIVAYMTELAKPTQGMTALEIGTGSGYQAAVLSIIVDSVYSIEIVPPLGQSAKSVLTKLGYNNVIVKVGDGYDGWQEKGPFDIIMVTAAADHIPPPLIEQLKEGGKMIIPVGSPFLVQQLMMVEKRKGKITTRSLIPVRFVPFTRESD